ncbi:hypothetical protein GCM10010504_52470 [Streptomyces griseus]|nr:hypothetical protein GCM10010504_52470 [Streptomyces griseus]
MSGRASGGPLARNGWFLPGPRPKNPAPISAATCHRLLFSTGGYEEGVGRAGGKRNDVTQLLPTDRFIARADVGP